MPIKYVMELKEFLFGNYIYILYDPYYTIYCSYFDNHLFIKRAQEKLFSWTEREIKAGP